MRLFATVLPMLLLWTAPAPLESQANLEPLAQAMTVTEQMEVETRDLLSIPARLQVRDVPLTTALDRLQLSSGVPVAYSSTMLPRETLVTCDCAQVTVEEAMRRILAGTAFESVVVGEQLVVRQKPDPDVRIPDAGDVLAPPPEIQADDRLSDALEPPRSQPTGVLTGRVQGEAGQPLNSVQIYISALDVGVLTQANGRYLLQNVPAGTHELTVERIGYRSVTADITVEPGETIVQNFELSQNALQLDEVIVTGTPGGTERRALGNSVSQMDFEAEQEVMGAGSFEQALGNRIPSVQMTTPPTSPGGGTKFRIRGSSSLALSGDPLIYVDGIRVDNDEAFAGRYNSISTLDDLSPGDIESVEVIKGPAAATLYGTEASNGVIQIITKKGVEGDASFNASVELGSYWLWDPAGEVGEQFYRNEADEIVSHNPYELEKQPDRFGRDLFKYGLVQDYNVSARGGTDLFRYFASLNRSDEDGYTRLDSNESTSGRLSLTLVPHETVTIDLSGSQGKSTTFTPLLVMFRLDGLARPGQKDEILRGWGGATLEAQMNGRDEFIDADRSTWSFQIQHEPTSWFSQRAVAGIDRNDMRQTDIIYKSNDPLMLASYGSSAVDGNKSIDFLERETLTLDYNASLSFPLTESLSSVTSGGFQYFGREQTTGETTGRGFAVPALTTISSAAQTSGGEDFVENVTVGTYVQNQFSWQDRIFLTGALRFDENSAFGERAGAEMYPKLSAAWVLSEEGFWQESWASDVIPEIRLRGAWGASGQQPDAFAAQRLYRAVTGPEQQATLTPSAFGNADLGPERGEEVEVGFDAGLLDGRVNLEFTWYNRVTKDAIVNRPIPPAEGFPGSQFVNVGEIQAGGTEWLLEADVLGRGGPVRWNLSTAFATNWTEVVELGINQIRAARNLFHVEGFPVASFFDIRAVSADFVSGDSGPTTNEMCDGGTGRLGKEMGGAPVPCSEAVQVYYGQSQPSWTLNLSNSFTYGNWTLRGVVDGKFGFKINPDYLSSANQRHDFNLVCQCNAVWSAMRKFGARGGQVISDGDFIKLRELSLRYMAPESWADWLRLDRLSFVASSFEVATLWTKQGETTDFGAKLHDIETQWASNEFSGVQGGAIPPGTRATFRVNVSF